MEYDVLKSMCNAGSVNNKTVIFNLVSFHTERPCVHSPSSDYFLFYFAYFI